MNIQPDTVKDARETVSRLAADSFKDHVLKKVSDERWLCKRPGTGQYHFFVILCPGTVIVYGDVGEGIFRHAGDAQWLSQSVNDPGYLLGKLADRPQDFYVGDVVNWAKEMVQESESEGFKQGKAAALYRDICSLAEDHELNPYRFYELTQEHGFDFCGRIGVADTAGNFWLVEALKTFVRLSKEQV